ncbi:hypothetical protein COBT_002801 [Conglomerata obtusa]
MQKDKCLIVVNLPSSDHKSNLNKIHALHHSTLSIKLTNSVMHENMLIASLHSKAQIQEMVKNIDKKMIQNNIIFAFSYDDRNNEHIEREIPELKEISAQEIVKINEDMKNEKFIICNDGSICEFENIRSGELTESYKMPGNSFKSSANGFFTALVKDNGVSIYVTDNGGTKLFNEIFIGNIKNMYFVGGDIYLAIVYWSIGDITSIYNIFTGKKVFEGRIGNNTIKFNKNLDLFYFENTNQVFRNVNFNAENTKNNLIFKNICNENFKQQNKIFNIENYEIFYEANNLIAILTSEKIKNIIIFYNEKEVLRKNYINIDDVTFYSSNNKIYAIVEKKIKERNVYSVDSFSNDGKMTITLTEKKIKDLKVADSAFVAVTDNYEVFFYGLKGSTFTLFNKIKKTHKVIISLNNNGNICVLYDYEKDIIEFYDQGNVLNKYSHPGCTAIEWSQSGLYCCSMSVGLGTSGLIQMYDVNGRFLYKRMFAKLTHFEWKKYLEIQEIKEKAKQEYKNMYKDIEEEDEDLIKLYEVQAKENTEELISAWKEFIIFKRLEIEEYKNENK